MINAIFCMDTWMGHEEYPVSGETFARIIDQCNVYQDFACLSKMAKREGNDADKKEIRKLDEFLSQINHLTCEEVAEFELSLSIGKIYFKDIVVEEEELK